MTARDVMEQAREAGISIRLGDGDLVVTGPKEEVLKFLPMFREQKPGLLALLQQQTLRCPACGSVGHTTPGAPGCDRREVVSARRYPAPLLWRGSEKEWTAGAPQPPLPLF